MVFMLNFCSKNLHEVAACGSFKRIHENMSYFLMLFVFDGLKTVHFCLFTFAENRSLCPQHC